MTSFAPDYSPRLADMVSLGGEPPVVLDAQLLEARRRGPRVTDAATLKDRTGYAADFLGDFHVSWPFLTGSAADDHGFSNEENATGTRIEAELRAPADVRV